MTHRSQTLSHPSRFFAAGALRTGVHVVVMTAVLFGCTRSQRPAQPLAPVKPPSTMAKGERVSDNPVRAPGAPGAVVGSALSLDLRPLGFVPTDGFTLPLFSPDGRYFAVQVGAVPELSTLLARNGQRAPKASRIAMYRADDRGLVRLGETESGFVLGRSSNASGFLIESPRSDGARWIGRINWDGGEPEWLVQDSRVNAFGVFGPAGELAYSSREKQDRTFDLVVRREGTTSKLLGDGVRSYILPVFTADARRVCAISLRDGILEVASADPTSDDSFRQSLVRLVLSDRGNDETALKMLAPQGARDGADGADWIFFHPTLNTLARWNDVDGLRPFASSVLAFGRVDARRYALLQAGKVRMHASDDALAAASSEHGTVLLDSVAVPRASRIIDGAPSVLLVAPEREGARLGVRLLLARLPQLGS